MTYTQQVRFWQTAYRTSLVLGALGFILWWVHPTTAATVGGVLLGPLGTSGGLILYYEAYKVERMEDTEVITYVTRGQLRAHTIGAMVLTGFLSVVFLLIFLHLVVGIW